MKNFILLTVLTFFAYAESAKSNSTQGYSTHIKKIIKAAQAGIEPKILEYHKHLLSYWYSKTQLIFLPFHLSMLHSPQ